MPRGITLDEPAEQIRMLVQEVVGALLHGPPVRKRRRPGTSDYDVILGDDRPYALGGPSHTFLRARLRLRGDRMPGEAEPWGVAIVAYQYALLDASQREILAFHLHPDGRSQAKEPHLHLGSGAGEIRADVAGAHIPTGRVSLAAVARLAITGFSAQPQRPAWDTILRRAEPDLLAAHDA